MSDIDIHPVFLGLSRPAMIFGLEVNIFGFIFILSLLCWMVLKRPVLAVTLFTSLYLVMWAIGRENPQILKLYWMKWTMFKVGQNMAIWGKVKSYAPY
ncbi:MAG: VirB3 family type IV secretion system protein [Legionellales bacterium]|nr:VirB3 family type IV secretion system protein [Legionellales bacterium]